LTPRAIVRSVVERISRRVVLRRRLPREYGGHRIYVSPDASLRFWRRDLRSADPFLFDICAELVADGDVVWDVGANVGLFALAAACRASESGAVLAVEPDPFLVRLLRRSSHGLPAPSAPVEVLHAAVSDRQGIATFTIASRSRAASHLASVDGSSQAGGVRDTVEVVTVTLDDLLVTRRAPAILKIDVEGAELLCLQGATRLLSTARPVILSEVAGRNSAAVERLLRQFDYTLQDASVPKPARTRLDFAPWNTLAFPA